MGKARGTSLVLIDAQDVFALSLMLDCDYCIEVQGGLIVEGKNCAVVVASNKEDKLAQMGSIHLLDGDRVNFDDTDTDSMCCRGSLSYMFDLDMFLEVNLCS